MSSALFKELEKIIGKDQMAHLCQDYLVQHALDNSGNRVWKDCSGESMAVYPKAWQTPTKESKTPIKIPGAPVKQKQKQEIHLTLPPDIIRSSINELTD
jgi:hypothetical protein